MSQKVRVGVVGFGTIGKRVADAVIQQPDMELSGTTINTYNYRVQLAYNKGIKLYTINGSEEIKKDGIKIEGTMKDLIANSDIIIDCTPKKVGLANKEKYYVPAGRKAILQGGEKAHVAEASFVAQCNYEKCAGLDYVRVVSCNTTGLARTIGSIDEKFGVRKARVTLIRRATDPWDSKKGPIDAIVPDLQLPTHHGPDLQTILPHIDVMTTAVVVPTTLMHLHTVSLETRIVPSKEEVVKVFERSRRVRIIRGVEKIISTAQIIDMAKDLGTKRGDMSDICIWDEGISVVGNEIFYHQAVHQESDVVPENIDAVRSMMKMCDAEESMKITDETLKIGTG